MGNFIFCAVESREGVHQLEFSVFTERFYNDVSLKDYFCSEVFFNLSRKILLIFLRKCDASAILQNKISKNFSEIPAFRTKPTWNPPNGHSALKIFLSKVEENVFLILHGKVSSYKLTMDRWLSMGGLTENCSMDMKPKDKNPFVDVWDRKDYLTEAKAENQPKDTFTYEEVKLLDKKLMNINDESNQTFSECLSNVYQISTEEFKVIFLHI